MFLFRAMKDIIMFLSSVLFGILFSFLVFIFSIFIISMFFKRKYGNFEPKVSIIVPAYNEERIIEKGLLEKYSEDRDEEGLTPSERYKVEYANRFIRSGKFNVRN